jgi:hypothetical protein
MSWNSDPDNKPLSGEKAGLVSYYANLDFSNLSSVFNVRLKFMSRWKRCKIAGCLRAVQDKGAKGMCNAHYRRFQRNGDPRAEIPIRHYFSIQERKFLNNL